MRNKIQSKEEFSDKLKKRAIFEGFAVSGIASIPGGSRLIQPKLKFLIFIHFTNNLASFS